MTPPPSIHNHVLHRGIISLMANERLTWPASHGMGLDGNITWEILWIGKEEETVGANIEKSDQ